MIDVTIHYNSKDKVYSGVHNFGTFKTFRLSANGISRGVTIFFDNNDQIKDVIQGLEKLLVLEENKEN